MDLITGQRTFFLGVSGANPNTFANTSVTFRDTSGNTIKCNYFKVDVVNNLTSNTSGCFVVEPVGPSIFKNVGNNAVCYATTALPTSGICGIGSVFVGNASVEWHGSNGEVCTGINIRAQAAGNPFLCYGITYGNLLPFNPLKVSGFSNLGQYGTEYDKGR
jgi:hypothetical protein